jgi:hypothetical protein
VIPKSTTSNVFGTILMSLAVAIFILWGLDYADVVRPGERPDEWGIIVMATAALVFGFMLRAGKGDSIAEAFFSWFKRKGG